MSIDVSVDADLPIPLSVLVNGVTRTLRELLDVALLPAIDIAEVTNGTAVPARPNDAIDAERGWLLSLDGYDESAFVSGMEVEDLTRGSGVHRFVSVAAGGIRTPLELALVAAVAVVIARQQATQIADDAQVFTETLLINPEDLVSQLRARGGPFDDLSQAANELAHNLHCSLSNSEDSNP